MPPELDEKAIFHVLISLSSPAERVDYLNFACGQDSEARGRIEALVAAHEAKNGLLDKNAPVDKLGTDNEDEYVCGRIIGRYKILEQIGEGGFGIVFMAEQQEPIRRRVALKVIKAGMDTRQVIARFEAERQALAMMDHPNIAKVLDADATGSGRPFFVMELVRGIPVTEYSDQHGLSTKQRLRIFTDVCAAVQYAHQKGIIHRDIKPSNILVGQDGDRHVPKVIDFGVAKATQGQLTDKTLFTQFRQFVGTPAYMSPEQTQSSVVDTDTRSDIYSLGVLLYELLTGQTPLDSKELQRAGFDEMCRRVREEEPPTPSARLSRLTSQDQSLIANQRGTDPLKLTSELHGELDWIAMKALDKDRTRRYDTAISLKEDLERFLNNQPVLAVAPSAAYRFSKFVRRNRNALAVVITIISLLLLGSVVSTLQAIRANRNALEARNKTVEAVRLQKAAGAAKGDAEVARARAEQARIRGEQLRYGADMSLVQAAIQLSDVGRAKTILDGHVPSEGEVDLRGWEWRFLYGQLVQEVPPIRTHYSIHALAVSRDGRKLAVAGRALRGHAVPGDVDLDNIEIDDGDLRSRNAADNRGEIIVLDTKDFGTVVNRIDHPGGIRQLSFTNDAAGLDLVGRDVVRRDLQHNMSEDWSPPVDLWPLKVTSDRKYAVGLQSVGSQKRARKKVVCYALEDSRLMAETEARLVPDWIWLSRELQISPNGNRVTFACSGRELKILSIPGLVEQQIIKASGDVAVVGWSADGARVATGYDYPFRVDVWNADTGERTHTFTTPTSPGSCITFSTDRSLLAFAELHDLIHVYDLKLNEERHVFVGHEGDTNALQFLEDGATLVSGGRDGLLKTWDASPAKVSELRRASEEHELWFMDYSPDGRMLAFSAADGIVRLFDAKTKTLVDTLEPANRISGRPLGWPRSQVRFSRDGRTLVVDNNDDTFAVYDVMARKRRFNLTHPAYLFDVDISPDGSLIATAGIGKVLVVWNANTGEELLRVDNGNGRNIDSVTFCPDLDSRLIAYESDDRVTLMDLDTQKKTTIEVDRSQAWSLTFSHDGSRLYCGCLGRVDVYDVPSMKLLRTLPGSRGPIPNIAVSPDDRTLAIPNWGGYVQLWSRTVNAEVGRLPIPIDSMACARFSPDGAELIVSTWGKGVFVFRAPTLKQIAQGQSVQAVGEMTP